jgi:predicted dehydrogenase
MDYPEPAFLLARTFDDFMGDAAFKGPWGIPDAANGTTDVEAACHAFLTFKTGQCLAIRNSWAEMVEREAVSVIFQGSRAGGKVERLFGIDGIDSTAVDTCELYLCENGNQVNQNILTEKDETMGRVRAAANFIDTIAGKAEPLNKPEEALVLMKIIDAIYESAASGKPVALN